MNSYRDLIVWQKAFRLAKEIYRLTGKFPHSEMYGLSAQLRRASVSIVSNIAEGFSRKSYKENQQFLSVAFGSSSEVETQILLAKDLGYSHMQDYESLENLLQEVRKMLNTMLRRSISNS